jgi:hypothetical protein
MKFITMILIIIIIIILLHVACTTTHTEQFYLQAAFLVVNLVKSFQIMNLKAKNYFRLTLNRLKGHSHKKVF